MSGFDVRVYENAFRSIDTPALITDTGLVVRDVNEAGLAFTGYEYEEFVGQSATVISDDEEIYADIVETILDDEPWSGDFELRTKEGDSVFGRGSVAPVVLDGETKGYVAVFIDTTEQRRYENAMDVLNRLLRHDLRNDLNVAYGNLQNARSRVDDEDVSAALEQVEVSLSRVINRSERARNLGELLEQAYGLDNRPVRLDQVLHEALIEAINRFEDAHFRFETFPEIHVVADHLLRTVLTAVLENAVIHNDAASPIVDVDVEEHEEDVVVRVTDNGPGVPEEAADLIFGREELDQLHHGSGISLFFADTVVKSYNGDIDVDTDRSEGAEFRIRLNRPSKGDG